MRSALLLPKRDSNIKINLFFRFFANLDKQGNRIVDPIVIERGGKGHPIRHKRVAPVPSSILFTLSDDDAVRQARLEQNEAMVVGDVERVASFSTILKRSRRLASNISKKTINNICQLLISFQ